jgi:Fe-S-cluster containining protein
MPRTKDICDFVEALGRSLDKMGAHLDRQVAERSKELGRDIGCTSCTSGACCTSVLACTLYDGLPAALYLRRAGLDTAQLRATLSEVGEKHHRTMLVEPAGKLMSEPCPMQGPDKRCIVYPARPLICRAHVVWGDPEDCVRQGGHRRLLTSHLSEDLWVALGLAARWTEEQLALHRAAPYLGTLPRTVLYCLEAIESGSLDRARAALHRAEGLPTSSLGRIAAELQSDAGIGTGREEEDEG